MRQDAVMGVIDALSAFVSTEAGFVADRCWHVGVSGGVDSLVLLHALCRLQSRTASLPPLVAVHVHHGLSRHADDWVRHVDAFARSLSIPLVVLRLAQDAAKPISAEAALRYERYRLLAEAGVACLWLAHHADDQLETVLQRLLRGSGLHGLQGMRPTTTLTELPTSGVLPQPLRVARPLLTLTRSTLIDYARHEGIDWIEDDSNDDTRLTRNFLRHKVAAPLKQRFSHWHVALATTLDNLASEERLVAAVAQSDWTHCARVDANALSLTALAELDDERRRNLLGHWCGESASPRLIAAAVKCLGKGSATTSDGRYWLVGRDLRLAAWRGLVYKLCGVSTVDLAEAEAIVRQAIDQPHALKHGSAAGLLWDLSPGHGVDLGYLRQHAGSSLGLQLPRAHMRLLVDVRRPSQRLKNLWASKEAPPWRRSAPILTVGGVCVYAPELGVDPAAAAKGDRLGISWRLPAAVYAPLAESLRVADGGARAGHRKLVKAC